MAHAVFLRAANVGGTNVFRPAEVARALKALDVVNIGAAGTFVVRSGATQAAIRAAFGRALPFEPVMALRPGKEILALVARAPFEGERFSKDLRGWVGVMTARATERPTLPHSVPPGSAWSVRLDEVDGPFALGLWRRDPRGRLVPGTSIEKALGVPVTVRWWETVVKVARIIEAGNEE